MFPCIVVVILFFRRNFPFFKNRVQLWFRFRSTGPQNIRTLDGRTVARKTVLYLAALAHQMLRVKAGRAPLSGPLLPFHLPGHFFHIGCICGFSQRLGRYFVLATGEKEIKCENRILILRVCWAKNLEIKLCFLSPFLFPPLLFSFLAFLQSFLPPVFLSSFSFTGKRN